MSERLAFLAIFVFYLFFYIFRRKEFTDANLFIREKIKSKTLRKMALFALYATSFLFIPLEARSR